jgi:hypothetical protein
MNALDLGQQHPQPPRRRYLSLVSHASMSCKERPSPVFGVAVDQGVGVGVDQAVDELIGGVGR